MENELELPEGFNFEELRLKMLPLSKDVVIMNEALLYQVLAHNGLDTVRLKTQPYHLIVCVHALDSCYRQHIARGGKPNEIMERLNS